MSLKNYWLQSPLKFQTSGFGRVPYRSFKLLTLAGIYQWVIHFISAFISKDLFNRTFNIFELRVELRVTILFELIVFWIAQIPWSTPLQNFFPALPFNTLTFNYEYSRCNRENLQLPIQMHLSEKPKPFIKFLFLESALNFKRFEKKNEPHSLSIFEVTDSERRTYLNA